MILFAQICHIGILNQSNKETSIEEIDTTLKCKWDKKLDYSILVPEMLRIIKPNHAIALFAQAPFTFDLYNNMIKYGAKWKYNWIWDKNNCSNFACLKSVPGKSYEEIMIFYKPGKRNTVVYYPQGVVFNKEVKVKLQFYSRKTNEIYKNDKIFDEVIIPYFQDLIFNEEIKKDVKIKAGDPESKSRGTTDSTYIGGKTLCSFLSDIKEGSKQNLLSNIDKITYGKFRKENASNLKNSLQNLLNDTSVSFFGQRAKSMASFERGLPLSLILDKVIKFKDFEIDFKNKQIYRTVKTYTGYPRAIIQFQKSADKCSNHGKFHHPTQKPVKLLEYLINTHTLENENVIDLTMGSGSTGVAAKHTNRNFIGFELLPSWFNVAKDRLEIE